MTEEAQPESLQLESQVFSLAFHPSQDIVATGLITGDVHCYRYGLEKNEHIYSGKYHKKSCRTIEFSHDGKMLYSGSRDKSIQGLDIETQQVTFIKAKAHEEPINTMLTLNERYLATGDDAGVVKLWDMRKQGEALMWHENSDFISKITYVPEKKTMVVAGGDGCLSIFDIRKTEAVAVSENQDDELLSVQVIKNGR
ncbi:WD domain repeat-containing protein 55 [Basidiobolus ranarum]|uniref:WD repeat-containing protein JIP5 n=1 Tax=Basidiobolus ranarum TaxID=34480 RepID=A0ABR2VQM8_9FUNG